MIAARWEGDWGSRVTGLAIAPAVAGHRESLKEE